MNQQLITDHAEHCDFYVGNEHWDKSYEEQQRLWVEKFAELIVRECCSIVNDRTQHNNQHDCPTVLDIKEHFGGEE
jgi:hypothetical protein